MDAFGHIFEILETENNTNLIYSNDEEEAEKRRAECDIQHSEFTHSIEPIDTLNQSVFIIHPRRSSRLKKKKPKSESYQLSGEQLSDMLRVLGNLGKFLF